MKPEQRKSGIINGFQYFITVEKMKVVDLKIIVITFSHPAQQFRRVPLFSRLIIKSFATSKVYNSIAEDITLAVIGNLVSYFCICQSELAIFPDDYFSLMNPNGTVPAHLLEGGIVL